MSKPLRVKFLSKTQAEGIDKLWSPMVPSEGFEGIEFTFDQDDTEYDFLVVYEGLPQTASQARNKRIERLHCAVQNTLLITTEPSSIRIDGPHFMRQFGHILTSKSTKLTRHPNHISETPPLRWFFGRPMIESEKFLSVDHLRHMELRKTSTISTVCSTKQMSHSVHADRLGFVRELSKRLPELEVYGRGVRPVTDKAQAMTNFRYHIAIENHVEPGHWTEKLSDCFLAGCLPFYFGDPDYAKAFPEQAVIPIDIYDIDNAERIIRTAIAENAYKARAADIKEAKRRVLDDYNTLGWVAKFVRGAHVNAAATSNSEIQSRYAFRRQHPIKGLSDLIFRTVMRHHPTAKPIQR